MKMKKNVIIAISALTLTGLLLTGCGSKNVVTPTPTPNQTETTTPTEKTDSIASLTGILGKSDEDVKDMYGGGKENKTEDGSVLLGRSYETTLDGNAVTFETVYSEKNTVSSAAVTFTGKSTDEVKKALTAAFGEPKATDESEAMDSKYFTWTTENATITLNESYGLPIAEFTLIGG